MRKWLTEFVGTFFLVLSICLSVLTDAPLAAVSIGTTLMVMVYMGGHVSGAHYNPAVSLAVLLRGKLSVQDFIAYIVSQILGALAAALIAHVILGHTAKTTFAVAPGAGVSTPSALLVEILYTFALALVVLNVATSSRTQGNSYYGLAIGFAVTAGAIAGGGISGGAFNPAVGTGPNVIHALVHGGSLANVWIYWVGPLLGGALAAGVFRFQEEATPAASAERV